MHKLKPIQGGGGSILSQNNNGMSYIGQMESSEGSNSNISLKAKLNLSPQQLNQQLPYNRSGQNILHKCNSSPMNSFIKKSNSRPLVGNQNAGPILSNSQHGLHLNAVAHQNPTVYNTQHQLPHLYKEIRDQDENYIVGSGVVGFVGGRGASTDQTKFVYKSNSQKSINWEGTPQNQTHKSVNNKNTGSQSHQSLFSQGKGLQSSSKKILMPSGSSGTLFRKEIIEMDEVNSSSSSSIGREENANQAFNASSKMKKIGKLNFTGKPFAPDSIFVNNIVRNLGDEDEGDEFDHISEITTNKASDQLKVINSNIDKHVKKAAQGVSHHAPSGIAGLQTINFNTQNPAKELHQSEQHTTGQKSTIKVLKAIKNNGGNSKKVIAHIQHSNVSPSSKQQMNQHQLIAQPKIAAILQAQNPSGRTSLNPQSTALADPQVSKIKSKMQKGTVYQRQPQDLSSSSTSTQKIQSDPKAQFSQTQKVRVSFVENTNNNMTQLNSASSGGKTTEEIKTQTTPYQTATLKGQQILSSQSSKQANSKAQGQKVIQQSQVSKYSRTGSESQSDSERQFRNFQHQKDQYSSQYSTAQAFPQNQNYSSKSPAEKMIESTLFQGHPTIGQTSASLNKKLMTQDIQGISHTILTPNKNSTQLSSRRTTQSKDTLQSKAQNTQQQVMTKQKQQAITERKSLLGTKQSAKTSSHDLSNLSHEDYSSPTLGSKMRMAQQQYSKLNMMGEVISNRQSETINDDLNIYEEEVIHEQDDDEEPAEKQMHQLHNHMNADQFIHINDLNMQSLVAATPARVSPSKSNKVPNSLAFKRRSNDSSDETLLMPLQIKAIQNLNEDKRFTVGPTNLMQIQSNFKLTTEDESKALSTRRPNGMFTLKDKQELNRNIPFSKQPNMDFSSGKTLSPSTQKALLNKRLDLLAVNVSIFQTCILFLDFENLLRLISISRKFREELHNNPSQYRAEIFKAIKVQLKQLLVDGLSSTRHRIKYWNYRTQFCYEKKKKPNLYKTLKKQRIHENTAAEIRKDVSRTFPDMWFFQKPQVGQKKLFNILNALAQKNSATGYIQGMNFLAGTILINLQRGEETFYMMLSILTKYKFDSIIDLKNGGLFQILCFQLEVFMQNYIPRLADHFKRLSIPTDIYAANWLITMFCYELSLDLVFCILDVFLLEGIKSLLKVSLALLKFLEDRLLQMNFDECMEFLSHSQKDIQLDSQTLLKAAFEYKITKSLLQDLELFYKLKNNPKHPHTTKIFKAFNRIQIHSEKINKKKKYSWIVLPATPDDLQDVLNQEKNMSEEEIHTFFQNNIKNRKLREIVEELQTEEDSEIANVNSYAIEKKDIQNAKMLQPSQRKKETLHAKYAQSAATNQKRRTAGLQMMHFKTDSNNTIVEMTHDYSRGGQSAGGATGSKQNNNMSCVTSHQSAGEKLQQSSENQNMHLSLIMKPSEDMLVTPRKIQKINNDLTAKNSKRIELSSKQEADQSPFIQIGTKIKSIFGNFFKTQEKLNKSYEEINQGDKSNCDNIIKVAQNDKPGTIASSKLKENHFQSDLLKKQARSKSIHNSILKKEVNNALVPSSDSQGPEIKIITQGYSSNQVQFSQSSSSKVGKSPFLPPKAQVPSNQKKHSREQTLLQLSQTATEDDHNIPNSHQMLFNSTAHLPTSTLKIGDQLSELNLRGQSSAMVQKRDNLPLSNLNSIRIQKQISKSVERTSEFDSMIQEEDCELDLLSSSDYAIGTVSENVMRKKQDFSTAERPEILIAKDLIAGDEEILESQQYMNMEIQTFNINNKHLQFNFTNANNNLSSNLKASNTVSTNQGSSISAGVINIRKQGPFSSNQQTQQALQNPAQAGGKIMKSSPPVSPKEKQYHQVPTKLTGSTQMTQFAKTPAFLSNSRKR